MENEEYVLYQLPEPRAPYEPFNRLINLEKDTGIFKEIVCYIKLFFIHFMLI